MAEDGVNDAMLRENLGDVVRHLKNGVYLSCMADSAYAQSIIWANERIRELESQKQSQERSDYENPGVFASPQSDEEIHQRRRRERMLDEITLSCVRGLLHGDAEEKTYEQIGDSARDRAEDICHGIKKYDAA